MDYSKRWHIIEKLGEGGQGEVHRVIDKLKINFDNKTRPDIEESIRNLSSSFISDERNKKSFELF